MELSLDNLKVDLNAIKKPLIKEPEKTPDPSVTSCGKETGCQIEEVQQQQPIVNKEQPFIWGGTTGLQGSKGVRGSTGLQGIAGTTGVQGYGQGAIWSWGNDQSPIVVIPNRLSPITIIPKKDYVEKTIETSDGFVVRTRVGRINRDGRNCWE